MLGYGQLNLKKSLGLHSHKSVVIAYWIYFAFVCILLILNMVGIYLATRAQAAIATFSFQDKIAFYTRSRGIAAPDGPQSGLVSRLFSSKKPRNIASGSDSSNLRFIASRVGGRAALPLHHPPSLSTPMPGTPVSGLNDSFSSGVYPSSPQLSALKMSSTANTALDFGALTLATASAATPLLSARTSFDAPNYSFLDTNALHLQRGIHSASIAETSATDGEVFDPSAFCSNSVLKAKYNAISFLPRT